MRVAIYEPTPTGHHFALLRHVLPALAALDCEPVLVTTPTGRRSPEFALHLGGLGPRVTIDTSLRELENRRGVSAWRHELDDLRSAVRRLAPDHVYVPYGEGLVRAAGLGRLFGSRPWPASVAAEVLLVRGGFQYAATSRLAHVTKRVAPWIIRRGPWDRIHHLSPDDHAALVGRRGRFADRCRLMPDPVEPSPAVTKAQARQALGIPEDGRYVGCVGRIGWRKGSGLLISAYRAAARRLRPSDRLLLAGEFEPEVREQASRELREELKSGRAVLLDRLLTAEELGLAIAALDLVCTPYRNHPHAASIVIRAAAAGRPVLGSPDGWMGRTIARFGLGTTCAVDPAGSLSQALVGALDDADGFELPEAARRFVAFHSVPNFLAHWTAWLRRRMGLPDAAGLVDWSWVTSGLPVRTKPAR